MSEQVPMPKTMEELQALLDRPNYTLTRSIAIELPRMVKDPEPRCAMVFAGPDAYLMLQYVANFVESLCEAATAKVSAPTSNAVN